MKLFSFLYDSTKVTHTRNTENRSGGNALQFLRAARDDHVICEKLSRKQKWKKSKTGKCPNWPREGVEKPKQLKFSPRDVWKFGSECVIVYAVSVTFFLFSKKVNFENQNASPPRSKSIFCGTFLDETFRE